MALQIIMWSIYGVALIFSLTSLTGAPFVPSRAKELRQAFKELYKLGPNDLLVDLGSGDGIVLKIASEFGAKAVGIEINPFLIIYSKLRLLRNKNARVKSGNLFKAKFPPETTIVYAFSVGRDIEKIVNAIQQQADSIGRDLYVISYAFRIPQLKLIKGYRAYYLYKVKHVKN